MQGLAMANGKGLVGVSALDALALAAQAQISGSTLRTRDSETEAIAVWMDAQRREVFAAIYGAGDLKCLDGPLAVAPEDLQSRWQRWLERGQVCFVGDGAVAYGTIISRTVKMTLIDPTPLMAPAVATLAAREAARGRVYGPELVRPLYVRRPDAELARDRRNVRVDR